MGIPVRFGVGAFIMKKKRRNFFILVIIFVFLVLAYFFIFKNSINNLLNVSPEELSSFYYSAPAITIIIYLLIMVLEVVIAPFHPFLFYVAGSIIFGPLLACILAILGGIIGGIIAFYIAKKLGRAWVEKRVAKSKQKKFDRFSKKYGGWAIFLLRLNPLTSTDLWNYVAGLSKVSFWSYIIGTTLGLIPATVLQIYLGVPIKNSPILFNLFLFALIIYIIAAIVLLFLLRKKN